MSHNLLSKSTKRRRVLKEMEGILPSFDTEEEFEEHESCRNESLSYPEMTTVFQEQSHSGQIIHYNIIHLYL